MSKVTVTSTFIGQPEEMAKYGGGIPKSFQKMEKKMSEPEKASFEGKIHVGTDMDVTDRRKEELLKLGLIEGAKEYQEKAKKDKEATEKQGPKDMTRIEDNTAKPEKKQILVKEKAETTKSIPTQKKRR